MEFEDGTQFLLCTDGITRHIPDNELRQLLILQEDQAAACEEMKKRCYERGAEDNLTAVLIRVGTTILAEQRLAESESTITPETELLRTMSPEERNGRTDTPHTSLTPPSRIAFPAPEADMERTIEDRPLDIPNAPARKSGLARTIGRLFWLLVFLAGVAGAFYFGTRFKGDIPFLPRPDVTVAEPQPSPVLVEDPILKFERARRTVDRAPADWLANQVKSDMAKQSIQNPLDSLDPEFLYLYGRALLLSGNTDEAAKAFEQAIARADLNVSDMNSTVRKEATIGLAATTLKNEKERVKALPYFDQLTKPAGTSSP
jgi:hypothetical protein